MSAAIFAVFGTTGNGGHVRCQVNKFGYIVDYSFCCEAVLLPNSSPMFRGRLVPAS